MSLDMYTPQQLLDVMFDKRQSVSTAYWLKMFYKRTHQSTQEEIRFDEIEASRQIAPFMLPNLPGRPMMTHLGETIRAFRPAYTKPKNALRPTDAIAMTGGEISRRIPLQSVQARWSQQVIQITNTHRGGITRLWEWMGARALIDGSIDIDYEDGPSVTIDFGRHTDHTVTLGTGVKWGDSGVSIFNDIQSWVDTVANAKFGGNVTDIMMGSGAASEFLADAEEGGSLYGKLDTRFRGSEDVHVRRGLLVDDPMNPFQLIGTLGPVNVWRVSGPANQFQSADQSFSNIMGANEVLLVAPGVEGIKAFGAILDEDANLAPLAIFPKMWRNPDPPATFIMSQSAPLMIPVNPNCTLKATVK